jgi:hypothetical protein
MPQCDCGSYAVNHHCHGRDGSDNNLCDVCYWRSRADARAAEVLRLNHNIEVLTNAIWKACGDDEEVVTATIESQGELR